MDLEDVEYTFDLVESTIPDYKCTVNIIEWLKNNMETITDDKNNLLFSKVNYGYNEETIKGFGKKPVCDVYIDNLDYFSDLSDNTPDKVNSFIICYLKGNMNKTYKKACELTDYLIQEFNENPNFRELDNIVKKTSITDVRLEIIPNTKTYGVLCAFSLEHELY